MKQILEHLESKFGSYDWRDAENSEAKLGPNELEELKKLPSQLKKDAHQELNADELKTLYKTGTYLMHAERCASEAADVLKFVYDKVRQNEAVREKVFSGDAYANLTNNLAFAMVNDPKSDFFRLNKAKDYISETFLNTVATDKNVEIISFAKRILGQECFARSKLEQNFEKKLSIVNDGIHMCIQGSKDLDPENKKHLSEIARTYNRNAIELVKLVDLLPIRLEEGSIIKIKNEIVNEAMRHASVAQVLWKTYDPDCRFKMYSSRNSRTLGEIHMKKYELFGGNINYNSSNSYLGKAAKSFEKLGNIEEAVIVRSQLLKLDEIKYGCDHQVMLGHA